MSGHSKWANIKVRKGAQDKKRSAVFTKMAKNIVVSVKRGGGVTDASINAYLRAAIDKAKEVNMPRENIERILKRFEERGSNLTNMYLEGFGPENVGVIIEVETDNKIRTSNEVKRILQEYGGSLSGNNTVMFQFDKVGRVELKEIKEEDWEKLIDMGASDIYENYVEMEFTNLGGYVSKLEDKAIEVVDFGGHLKAKMPLTISNKDRVDDLIQVLEELDDVVKVFVACQ